MTQFISERDRKASNHAIRGCLLLATLIVALVITAMVTAPEWHWLDPILNLPLPLPPPPLPH